MPSQVALYARVSTDDQVTEAQLVQLRQAARSRGRATWLEVSEVASGAGVRLRLDDLEAQARRGRLSELWIVALDRLGRSTLEVLSRLDRLDRAGCRVVALREGIDLSTPAGRLQAQLLAAFAEFERAGIIARTKAGLKAARAKGRQLGRPRVSVPWIDVVRRRELGETWATIARELGVSETTLRTRRPAINPPLSNDIASPEKD